MASANPNKDNDVPMDDVNSSESDQLFNFTEADLHALSDQELERKMRKMEAVNHDLRVKYLRNLERTATFQSQRNEFFNRCQELYAEGEEVMRQERQMEANVQALKERKAKDKSKGDGGDHSTGDPKTKE